MTDAPSSIATNAGGPGAGLLGSAWVDRAREGTLLPESGAPPPEACS